jgi:hypothetical protein
MSHNRRYPFTKFGHISIIVPYGFITPSVHEGEDQGYDPACYYPKVGAVTERDPHRQRISIRPTMPFLVLLS